MTNIQVKFHYKADTHEHNNFIPETTSLTTKSTFENYTNNHTGIISTCC